VTRAMTADIRDMVQSGARYKGRDARGALIEFDAAEREFGRLAEQNDRLHGLLNSRGEGAIATLLGATKEKGDDIRLLAQLRHSMSPQEFEVIGGTLLHELGMTTGDFSLARFVTNWKKTSDRAKRVLFSPQHLANINAIAERSLKFSNTSHTASTFVLYELIRDSVEGAIAVGAGFVDPWAAASTAASFGVANAFTRFLASPARASSMAAWTRAYQAAQRQPTAARVAAFKIATRNLANTLGLDPARGAICRRSNHGQ
jgi:hypothetical protein